MKLSTLKKILSTSIDQVPIDQISSPITLSERSKRKGKGEQAFGIATRCKEIASEIKGASIEKTVGPFKFIYKIFPFHVGDVDKELTLSPAFAEGITNAANNGQNEYPDTDAILKEIQLLKDLSKENPTMEHLIHDITVKVKGNSYRPFTNGMEKPLTIGSTTYPNVKGVLELREALAEKIKYERNVEYLPSEISIIGGGKPALDYFAAILCNPGYRMMLPNPGYPIYNCAVQSNEGIPIYYGYDLIDGNYRLNLEQFENEFKKIDDNYKLKSPTLLREIGSLQATISQRESEIADLESDSSPSIKRESYVLDQIFDDCRHFDATVLSPEVIEQIKENPQLPSYSYLMEIDSINRELGDLENSSGSDSSNEYRKAKETLTLKLDLETTKLKLFFVEKKLSKLQKHPLYYLNDNNNPTGIQLPKEDIVALAKLSVKYNAIALSDEVYFNIRYDDESSYSIVSEPGMKERTLLLLSASKEEFATGVRVGSVAGPKELIEKIDKYIIHHEGCANQPGQWGWLSSIKAGNGHLKAGLAVLLDRLDTLSNSLNDIPGVTHVKPKSGFYVWANFSQLLNALDYETVEKFRSEALEEVGIGAATEDHFGVPQPGNKDRFIRFAFSGISKSSISEGMNVFQNWIRYGIAYPKIKDQNTLVLGGGIIGKLLTERLSSALNENRTTLVTRHASSFESQKALVAPSIETISFGLDTISTSPDIIFVSTQVDDFERTISNIRSAIKGDKTKKIVLFQNGIDPEEKIREAFPHNPIARVIISVQVKYGKEKTPEREVTIQESIEQEEFGQSTHNFKNKPILIPKEISWEFGVVQEGKESVSGTLKTYLTYLSSFLNESAGFKGCEVVDNIEIKQWIKYFKNMGNIGSLSIALRESIVDKKVTYGDVLEDKDALNVTDLLTEESYAIAVSHLGDRADNLPDLEEIKRSVRTYIQTDHVSTTLENYSELKPIENILIEPLILAKRYGIAVPHHVAFHKIIEDYNKEVKAGDAV
jgi:aspartate/methionine/tyrosine aminotransferase/ketopantoate reductase